MVNKANLIYDVCLNKNKINEDYNLFKMAFSKINKFKFCKKKYLKKL